jgi:hypothetical protein
MGEVSGSGSCQGQEEIKRPNQGLIAFAGRYEMTAAAKCHQTLLWGVPEGRRSPKGRSVGTGRVLLALEVAADVIAEAGILSRDDDGLKRRLAPSSTQTARARDQPLRSMRGLGVLCPLSSFTIEHGSQGDKDAGDATIGLAGSDRPCACSPCEGTNTKRFDFQRASTTKSERRRL